MDAVALVTGAARGIGRGIARELGRAGLTVVVTDRESRTHRHIPLPGTVEDTAAQIDELGGTGIPVVLDHSAPDSEAQVCDTVERIVTDLGGLDLVVANACNGNARPFRGGPFWELPDQWSDMLDVGVRSHLDVARAAAPALIARNGLLVFTGFDVSSMQPPAGEHLYYDLAMSAVSRLARSTAHDLAPHGVTALALSPGFTATEAIVDALGPAPEGSDPIERPGKAIVALLNDQDRGRHAGRTLTVAEAAKDYAIDALHGNSGWT